MEELFTLINESEMYCYLVTDEADLWHWITKLGNFLQPRLEIFKGGGGRDVKDEEDSVCVTVELIPYIQIVRIS